MKPESFGTYLRELRLKCSPTVTQETLAKAIGRTKMTISQFEQEKNAPPQGELLEKIIEALHLTSDESTKLRFLAAQHRRTIPSDIEDYFFNHPCICDVIRAAQKANMSGADWNLVITSITSKIS